MIKGDIGRTKEDIVIELLGLMSDDLEVKLKRVTDVEFLTELKSIAWQKDRFDMMRLVDKRLATILQKKG